LPLILKIPKQFAKNVSHFHDHVFCRPINVRAQAQSSRRLRIRPDAISVAIAHYNRGKLAHRPLCNLLTSDLVAEVVFLDDASDMDEFQALKEFVASLHVGSRVRIVRREPNRGAQSTKLDAVAACAREWVLVLDSDNTAFPGFLRALGKIRHRNPETIYCSPYAFPYFSFAPFAGQVLDFAQCCKLTKCGIMRRVFIINDGNYLVHREKYGRVLEPLRGLKSDVADVFLANYRWLSADGRLKVLSNGTYHHRIDATSFWMRTADESRQRVVELFSRLEAEKKWDSEFAMELMK
jgi:glycosyltransferase involved in cell wall biosynthesis